MDDWKSLPELRTRKVGAHLRAPTFDDVVVPEETPPVRYAADDATINAYCYAMNCHDPWYFDGHSRFGQRIAPSAMILKELMWFYQTQYDRSRVRGFHQHEDFKFHAPVPAGAELIFTGRNTEKFNKRGKGYFRHVSEAHDRQGRLYVSQVNTEIIDLARPNTPDDPDTREGRRLTGTWSTAAPVSEIITDGIQAGFRLPAGEISFDRAQMAVFSGFVDEFVSLHTDRGVAAELGFPDVVVQGLMNVCWLSEELTRRAGRVWLSTGAMSATFLKPMLAGQTATAQTLVVTRADNRISLETNFINGQGETQAVAFTDLRVS